MCDKGLNGEKSLLHKPAHCFLAAMMLEEMGDPESQWQPYFDLLPKDVSEYPILFDDAQLKMLEGSFFLKQIEEDRKEIQHDYDIVCSEVSQFKKLCSFDKFLNLFLLILSRVFTIMIGDKKTKGMVPLVDMPNHAYNNNLKWYYKEEEQGYIIEAQDDIQRNQEVAINYGLQSNDLFFLRYGFINANNEMHNEVPMFAYLDTED